MRNEAQLAIIDMLFFLKLRMLLSIVKQTTKQNQRQAKQRIKPKVKEPVVEVIDKTSDELIFDASITLQRLKTLNAKMNKIGDNITPRKS